MKRTKQPERITSDQFIRTWRTATSREDVCKKTGLSRSTVSQRASRYRQQGVPLKRFPTGGHNKLDIPALRKLARASLVNNHL
jgi:transposase